MKVFRKRFALFALLLLSCLLLSAPAFAKELVVYSSVDEENAKNILDEFSKVSGIKVNMVFLSSGPAMSRSDLSELLAAQKQTNKLLQGVIYGGLGFVLGLIFMQVVLRIRLF